MKYIPGEVIERVAIEGDSYTIYLGEPMPKRKQPELRIAPLDIIEGGIMATLAKRIINKYGGRLDDDNFGGVSGGNPPDMRKVFAIPVAAKFRKRGTWPNMPKEAIAELTDTKQKLIAAMKELYQAMDRLVKQALGS